jgi:hypothetical protein
MHGPNHTITFLRKSSPSGITLFAAALHTDTAIEQVLEGSRNTVLAWCSALSPEMVKPATRCLDLLALLPPEIVQRLSVNMPSVHRSDKADVDRDDCIWDFQPIVSA